MINLTCYVPPRVKEYISSPGKFNSAVNEKNVNEKNVNEKNVNEKNVNEKNPHRSSYALDFS